MGVLVPSKDTDSRAQSLSVSSPLRLPHHWIKIIAAGGDSSRCCFGKACETRKWDKRVTRMLGISLAWIFNLCFWVPQIYFGMYPRIHQLTRFPARSKGIFFNLSYRHKNSFNIHKCRVTLMERGSLFFASTSWRTSTPLTHWVKCMDIYNTEKLLEVALGNQ